MGKRREKWNNIKENKMKKEEEEQPEHQEKNTEKIDIRKEINTTTNKRIGMDKGDQGIIKNWNVNKKEKYETKYETKEQPLGRQIKEKESDFWEEIGSQHPENLI